MDMFECNSCGYLYKQPHIWKHEKKDYWIISCPCCGFNFSLFENTDVSHISYERKRWVIKEEMEWFVPEEQPENWDIIEQIKNIPREYNRKQMLLLYFRYIKNQPIDFIPIELLRTKQK